MTYSALAIVLAISAAVSVFLAQGDLAPANVPAPIPVLALGNALVVFFGYGGLGFLGLKLSETIGFPEI
jgi:hypothetical protein